MVTCSVVNYKVWQQNQMWYCHSFDIWMQEKNVQYQSLPLHVLSQITVIDYVDWRRNLHWFKQSFHEWISEKNQYEKELYEQEREECRGT